MAISVLGILFVQMCAEKIDGAQKDKSENCMSKSVCSVKVLLGFQQI